jgi:hypothetical protein
VLWLLIAAPNRYALSDQLAVILLMEALCFTAMVRHVLGSAGRRRSHAELGVFFLNHSFHRLM